MRLGRLAPARPSDYVDPAMIVATHILLGRMPTLAAAALATLLAFTGLAAAQTNRIAAVVNGDVITQQEVDSRRRLLALSAGINTESAGRANDQILRLLIDERLRTQEVARRRIPVTDQDIATAVGEIETRNGLQPGGLRESLRRGGIDPRVLYDQIRAQIGWNRLLRGLIGDQAQITQAAVDEYLAAYQARTGQPEYMVSEIFIPVSNPGQDAGLQPFPGFHPAGRRRGVGDRPMLIEVPRRARRAVAGEVGRACDIDQRQGAERTRRQPGIRLGADA